MFLKVIKCNCAKVVHKSDSFIKWLNHFLSDQYIHSYDSIMTYWSANISSFAYVIQLLYLDILWKHFKMNLALYFSFLAVTFFSSYKFRDHYLWWRIWRKLGGSGSVVEVFIGRNLFGVEYRNKCWLPKMTVLKKCKEKTQHWDPKH